MADGKKMVTDFRFCKTCRRNHNDGRKHIYQRKHVNKLQEILKKFSAKMKEAKKYLKVPDVVDGELEPGAHIWCYCCSEEVPKHCTDGDISVAWGGVIEHMYWPTHHKNVEQFLRHNGGDRSLLADYTISNERYQTFKEKLSKAIDDLEEKKEKDLVKSALDLKEQEQLQKMVAVEPPQEIQSAGNIYKTVWNKYGVLQNPTGRHEGERVWGGGIVKYKEGSDQLLKWDADYLAEPIPYGSQSKEPFGAGLPSSALPTTEGNIHTGALPPWMMDDEEEVEAASRFIGPSLEAFEEYRKRLKRSEKNPKRVGATFHRQISKTMTEDDWLPSFGSVWNAGPRSHSKREFMKHLNKSSQSGDTAGPSLKTVNHPPPLKRSTVPATQSPDSTIIQTQKRQSLASPVNVSEVADILSCSSTQSDQTVVRPYTRKRKTY